MTQPLRFEAVVLRFVPDAGAGEGLNVGVAMRTLDGTFYDLRLADRLTRITDAFPRVHGPTIRAAFTVLRSGLRKMLEKGHLPFNNRLTEELRHLAPDADAALQWSEPISGVTIDPERTFAGLFLRFVDCNSARGERKESRTDAEIEEGLVSVFRARGVTTRLAARELRSPTRGTFAREFRHCWMNGVWNCVEPVSLDLLEARSIQDKAATWIGNVRVLHPSKQNAKVILYVGLPEKTRTDAYGAATEAIGALEDELQGEATVYRENQAQDLAARVEADLAVH